MRWFVQVYRWRAMCSIVWLCLLTLPVLLVYRGVATFSLLHPLLWISECTHRLVSMVTLFHCCLYLGALVVVMVMYGATETVNLPVYCTRLQVLWSALSPTHLFWVLLMGFLGGVKGHCLSYLSAHATIYGSGQLNEEWLFLVAHGVFSGVCFGWCYFTGKEHVLVIPSIQQGPLFSLRGHLTSHLMEGVAFSLRGLRWFYPLYFLTRSYVRSKVTNIFHLEWGTFVGFLNFELLFQVLLAGTLSHILCSFGLRMFRVFQSQMIQFPVLATFSSQSNRLLTDALRSKVPLLKQLAFLDLCTLAWQAKPRRAQVYSLDRAGRAGVWSDVCEQCLSVIDSLTHKLTGVTPPAAAVPPTASVGSDVPASGGVSKGWWAPEPPLVSRRSAGVRGAQLWSYSPPSKLPPPRVQLVGKSPAQWSKEKLRGVVVYVRSLPSALAQKLKRKPFFAHFLSPLPGTDEQLLYADSQLVVWAVTGMSELTVASYTEDQYGVVQRSLSRLLGSLINLSQALDKQLKAPLSSAPSTRNTLLALERNGKYAIKTAVLTSLHRLELTFARERRVFQLTDEQFKYWTTHSKL